jgi:hypothetical protein
VGDVRHDETSERPDVARRNRVTVSILQKLRGWLTIDEAAHQLSERLSEHVSSADVLRLAIDKQLRLSLYLPSKLMVRCQRIDDPALEPDEKHREIQGLCDVPMLGRAKLQIEHDYHWMNDRNFIPVDGPIGATVKEGEWLCKLPGDRGQTGMSTRSQSEFPQGSVLCVRRSALEEFIEAHVPTREGNNVEPAEKPLGERERATLLTLIGALAQEAGIDISKPSKAADSIEKLTETLGARVSARTIEDHLKRIPDAIERKAKSSS